jgi:hypothetical protein
MFIEVVEAVDVDDPVVAKDQTGTDMGGGGGIGDDEVDVENPSTLLATVASIATKEATTTKALLIGIDIFNSLEPAWRMPCHGTDHQSNN